MLLPVFVTVEPARTAKLDAVPRDTIGSADAGEEPQMSAAARVDSRKARTTPSLRITTLLIVAI